MSDTSTDPLARVLAPWSAPYRSGPGEHLWVSGPPLVGPCLDCGIPVTMWQAVASCPRPRFTELDGARRILHEKLPLFCAVPDVERPGLVTMVRAAMLLLSLGHPDRPGLTATVEGDWPEAEAIARSTRDIATRLHVVQELVTDIDVAVARGDAAAWRAYHAGEMTMNDLILRMWASGRERMGADPTRKT